MGIVFAVIAVFSTVTAFMLKTGSEVTSSVLSSGAHAVEFMLTAGVAITVYGGIMNIAERAGLCSLLSRAVRPLFSRRISHRVYLFGCFLNSG